MLDELFALSGAGGNYAAVDGLALAPRDALTAYGARFRHREFTFCACAGLCDGAKHFRNHFAGALNSDNIAYADIAFADVVLVVEGRALDSDPADLHRLKDGVGIERPRASDVDFDAG